jgi:protein-disulfide isomerase
MSTNKQPPNASQPRGRSNQRRQKRSSLRSYIPIVGVVVLVVAVFALLVILDLRGRSPVTLEEVASDRSLGAANAPVVVMEYADFQCPYCRQFATGPEVQLKRDYVDTGQVRFVFRHLAFIGQESIWAAEAAECAGDQGRFWEYHDKLFVEQRGENQGAFSRDNLKRFAADLGLDTGQFNQCLDSGQYQSRVQQEGTDAQRLGVTNTPTLAVNGQVVKDGSSYSILKAAIEAALRGQ